MNINLLVLHLKIKDKMNEQQKKKLRLVLKISFDINNRLSNEDIIVKVFKFIEELLIN